MTNKQFTYNLFLDDMRQPYQAFGYTNNPIYKDLYWQVVINYEQFIEKIEHYFELYGILPKIISFDHDLGLNDCEMWKDVIGYEGIYKVSNLGRVIRIKPSKRTDCDGFLTPVKNESGLYVTLRDCGNDCRKKIHRLVMESFIGINPNKPQVNHKDGNRWNNNINNLEWCDNSENVYHSHNFIGREYTAYGENHSNSKSVSQYNKDGMLIDVYGSINEAGRQLKIQFTNIAKCARGERKIAGGFIWKYENKKPTVNSSVEHIPKEEKDYTKKFFIPPTFSEKTGYDCAKWLVNFCMDNNLKLPEYYVHSMNPVGRRNILGYLDNYVKFSKNQKNG
jgi:hypothetical protein